MNWRNLDDRLSEKRRIPRQRLIVPLHCKLGRKAESGFGWVRDFSSTGANVMSSLSLTRGDVLTLSLPPAGRPEMEIAATVRWRQGPLLGIEFKSNTEAACITEQENDVDRLFRLLEELRLFLLSSIPSTPGLQKR